LRASKFRAHRAQLDAALGRQDLKAMRLASEAMRTEVENVVAVLGGAAGAGLVAIVEHMANGPPDAVSLGVAGAEAATRKLLPSSLAKRLLWRLRRPDLLFLNNLVDEAHSLTEALPDFAKIWRIPERDQERFAERFHRMALLQTS